MSRDGESAARTAPDGGGDRRAGTVAWIVLAVVVLGGAFLWIRRPTVPMNPPAAMPEVARSNLVFLDNRLILGGQPFSGFLVEHYPNGALRSRSVISNGVLNGVSEGWYTNEVLQVSEWFANGTSHGTRTQWDEQGRRVSEARIVNGKIEGVFRRWHDNGKISEEVNMMHGEAEGLSRAWYPSGFLKAKVTLVQGKVSNRHTFADGELEEAPEPWDGDAGR